MIKCSEKCIPCCDYCVHAIHEKWKENGKEIIGGPIGCTKHPDEEHREIADGCGYCKDFHCVNVKEEVQ